MPDEVRVRVLPQGVSGIDGVADPERRRHLLLEGRLEGGRGAPVAEPAPRADRPWTYARARALLARARTAGSARAAADFRIPVKRLAAVLAEHGLSLEGSAPARAPERASAPVAPPRPAAAPKPRPAAAPAPEPPGALTAAPGRFPRGFWTAERAGVLYGIYQARGVDAAAEAIGRTSMRVYQILERFGFERFSKGAGVALAAERRRLEARTPGGFPRGSVLCPRCGHNFIPDRPPAGLEE